ncbi:MAG: VanW family protein [Patescibacteria group bacterium]|jgi:vancomycin resistance protein YoaR
MAPRLNLAKQNHLHKPNHKKIIFFFLFIIVFLLALSGYCFMFQKEYTSTVYPKVYCNGLSLGGLKLQEVKDLLSETVDQTESQGFSFYAKTDLGEKKINTETNSIGLADPDLSRSIINFNTDLTAEKAMAVGRQGNIFQRFLEIIQGKTIYPELQIDKPGLQQILEENFKSLEKPVQNARIGLTKQGLVLLEETPGFVLDYENGIKQMETNLHFFQNIEVQIPIKTLEPQIKISECSKIFNQAQDLFNSASYILQYGQKEKKLPATKWAEWLEFTKDGSNQISLTLNQEKIKEFLEPLAVEIDVEPIEAQFKIENDKVVEFSAGQSGMKLNPDASTKVITQSFLDDLSQNKIGEDIPKNKEIKLIVEETKPTHIVENINDLGIKELVGRGVSDFSGSPNNRRLNIKVGSQKLNGILIKPEEEFSIINAIGPVDKEAGFFPELVIKGDRTVPEYGGGLCQLGTTMFRVALNAGLPITQRSPHSYRVVYYEPAGMDATIYSPQPDLRFINDTEHYLLLQTKIEGNNLIFELYGTPDGRKVETTKPKIFNITKPGPIRYIETDTLEPGVKKKVESAHQGADAEFKNIITFSNGTIREDVWKSHYKPWPEVWLIGKEKITAPEPQVNQPTN